MPASWSWRASRRVEPLLAFLLILGCVLALALGIWLGMPGRYSQTPEEMEQLMERGGRLRSRTVQRHFTPLDWWRKDRRASERRIEENRRRFRTATPEKGEAGDGGSSDASRPPRD